MNARLATTEEAQFAWANEHSEVKRNVAVTHKAQPSFGRNKK